MNRFNHLLAVFALLLLGCSVEQPAIAMTTTAITTIPAAAPPATLALTSVRAFQPVHTATLPVDTPTPVDACPPVDASVATTRHLVVADIDYDNNTANVSQRIRYINPTDELLTDFVLNLEPNRIANVLELEWITSEQAALNYTLRGKRLVINLADGLQPGCELTVNLDYNLRIPFIGSGSFAAKGYFSHTGRQMNLGHWLASVAVRQGTEWISREPSLIGEQEVLAPADWNVTLNLIGDAAGLTVAAPGQVTRISETSMRFMHNNSRDFSLSLSRDFNINAQMTGDKLVELYSFDNPGSASAHALDVAARSLELYQGLFGPYPYERLVIVQGDFPDGMEFSGLVFVGDNWFTRYPDTPASYLTLITVHEVSHQWWYARVGNDAALHPWLDEALSTYSEYLFLEAAYPDLADWWWGFRVNSFGPIGYVDSNIYQFSSAREYINAVYLRGVRMLHAIRQDIGDEAFFNLLRAYVAAGDGTVATPYTFWSVLTPEQFTLTENTRREFLREPAAGR